MATQYQIEQYYKSIGLNPDGTAIQPFDDGGINFDLSQINTNLLDPYGTGGGGGVAASPDIGFYSDDGSAHGANESYDGTTDQSWADWLLADGRGETNGGFLSDPLGFTQEAFGDAIFAPSNAVLGEEWTEDVISGVKDAGGEIVNAISDAASGMTEGDASSESFGKIWPYKQEQLEGASAAFGSDESMYPGFSADTQSYIDQIKGRVESGNITLNQAQQELGGLFGATNPQAGFFQDLAAGVIGQDDPSRGFYQQMQSGMFDDPSLQGYQALGESRNPYTGMVEGAMGGVNPALQELQKTSAGGYIGENPYLADIYERGAEDITDRYQKAVEGTNASFNLMGGFGSSARPDVLAERQEDLAGQLGGLYGDIYGGDYARERDRQLQATGQLGNLYDVGVGRGFQGAGMLSDIYGQDIGTQFGALSGASGASQQNLANQLQGAQGLSDVYQTGINRQLQGAGGASDIYGQGFQQSLQTIDPAFRFAQQDYSDLGMLGGGGGMQDVLSTQQAQEPWQRVSNYGAAIGGLPSSCGKGQNSPLGAIGGGLIGGYFGGLPGAKFGSGIGGMFNF